MAIDLPGLPSVPLYTDGTELAVGAQDGYEPCEQLGDYTFRRLDVHVFATLAEAHAAGNAAMNRREITTLVVTWHGYGIFAVLDWSDGQESGIHVHDSRDAFTTVLAESLAGMSAHERLAAIERLHAAIDAALA